MEKPASLEEKGKEKIFSEVFLWFVLIATILKVKSIAFQVIFFLEGAIGSFKNFKTFHVKAFFFKRKFIILVPRVAVDLEGVLLCTYYYCMVLFIYFFTVQISWKIFFFSKCQLGFILFFFFILSFLKYICCPLKHWKP